MIVGVITTSDGEILKATIMKRSTKAMITEAKEDELVNLNVRVTNHIMDHEMYHAKNRVVNNVNYKSSRRMMMGFEKSPVETRGDIDKNHPQIALDTPGMMR